MTINFDGNIRLEAPHERISSSHILTDVASVFFFNQGFTSFELGHTLRISTNHLSSMLVKLTIESEKLLLLACRQAKVMAEWQNTKIPA